jgi:hypothetical protein
VPAALRRLPSGPGPNTASKAHSKDHMDKMLAEGRIEFRSTGMPVFKRYLDEQPGVPLQDIWTSAFTPAVASG